MKRIRTKKILDESKKCCKVKLTEDFHLGDSLKTIESVGESKCSVHDQFDKSIGVKIAEDRAIINIAAKEINFIDNEIIKLEAKLDSLYNDREHIMRSNKKIKSHMYKLLRSVKPNEVH